MNQNQQSVFSDQHSAPTLNEFFEEQLDATPTRAESSYDFFGNSTLLIAES